MSDAFRGRIFFLLYDAITCIGLLLHSVLALGLYVRIYPALTCSGVNVLITLGGIPFKLSDKVQADAGQTFLTHYSSLKRSFFGILTTRISTKE